MKPYTLVVDIGNSSTSLGLYRAGRVTHTSYYPSTDTSVPRIRRLVGRLKRNRPVMGVSISSVVPKLNRIWTRAMRLEKLGKPLWIRSTHKLGIAVTYPRPDTIGADRLANASGGSDRHGVPLIVVDVGTATTIDVVVKRHGFLGGIIVPGPELFFSYLAERTAALPSIKPGRVKRGIGKSTREAMRLGAEWGYRAMIRDIVNRLRHNAGLKNANVCITGGFAPWVAQGLLTGVHVDRDLTLRGIGRIFHLNRA